MDQRRTRFFIDIEILVFLLLLFSIISNHSSSQPPRRYNISSRLASKPTSVNPPCLPRNSNASPLTVLPKTARLSVNPTLSLNPGISFTQP